MRLVPASVRLDANPAGRPRVELQDGRGHDLEAALRCAREPRAGIAAHEGLALGPEARGQDLRKLRVGAALQVRRGVRKGLRAVLQQQAPGVLGEGRGAVQHRLHLRVRVVHVRPSPQEQLHQAALRRRVRRGELRGVRSRRGEEGRVALAHEAVHVRPELQQRRGRLHALLLLLAGHAVELCGGKDAVHGGVDLLVPRVGLGRGLHGRGAPGEVAQDGRAVRLVRCLRLAHVNLDAGVRDVQREEDTLRV
mmetsp:Transcript_36626/g.110522  ORF Transcript_36626/g.110522 Transcript_36626/m.110522 type:complete len:251 (-) Transcript_36626:752-1504(-)